MNERKTPTNEMRQTPTNEVKDNIEREVEEDAKARLVAEQARIQQHYKRLVQQRKDYEAGAGDRDTSDAPSWARGQRSGGQLVCGQAGHHPRLETYRSAFNLEWGTVIIEETICHNIYLGGPYTSVTIDSFAHSQTVLLRGSHLILKIQENLCEAAKTDSGRFSIKFWWKFEGNFFEAA